MNWFDNLSTDSDQRISPARLVHGLWRGPLTYRVVIDLSGPRLVAAQVLGKQFGAAQDVEGDELDALSDLLAQNNVLTRPHSWGLLSCEVLPDWATPTFSHEQMAELERIQGYLLDASDEAFESVLVLRDSFLKGIGLTDRHLHRAIQTSGYLPRGARSLLN